MNAREAAARIDAIAVPVALERLERLGEAESGASRFYAVRLERGTLFSDYDIALAEALSAWPDAPRVIHEIGGGFANLSMLLSAVGFETVCLEMAGHRYGGARALLRAVREDMPELRKCRVVKSFFPDPELSPVGAMAVATNLVATTSDEARREIIEGLKRYDVSILDVDRFLTMVQSPAEREARLEALRAENLIGSPFLEIGTSACFYRFTPVSPAVSRKAPGGLLRRAFRSLRGS